MKNIIIALSALTCLTACSAAEYTGTRAEIAGQVYGTHFGQKQSNGKSYKNDNRFIGGRMSREYSLTKKYNGSVGAFAAAGKNSYNNNAVQAGVDAQIYRSVTKGYEAGPGVRLGACNGYKHVNNGGVFPCAGVDFNLRHKNPKKFIDNFGAKVNVIPDAGSAIDKSIQGFITYTIKLWKK